MMKRASREPLMKERENVKMSRICFGERSATRILIKSISIRIIKLESLMMLTDEKREVRR